MLGAVYLCYYSTQTKHCWKYMHLFLLILCHTIKVCVAEALYESQIIALE